MIRIGLRSEFEFVPEAAQLGYDYLELPLTRVASLSNSEFAELIEYTDAIGIRAEAMYDMLPHGLRITGPEVQARLQHDYLNHAFARARRLGAQVITFDAAASRNVPTNFDFAMARRQAGNFLRIVQGHASDFGIRVAICGMPYSQTNLINTVSEASLMAALLQLGNVGVAAHTIHMAYASEPIGAVERCGSSLMHVYTGCALTRSLPSENDGEDYAHLFRILAKIGYSGRVSAATYGECTAKSATDALRCLRAAREDSLT